MSSPHTIAFPAPRFWSRQATLAAALGMLVAIAATVAILALTGANQPTTTTPVTAPQVTTASVPQIRYLGPRQVQEAFTAPTTQASGTAAPGYACLGAGQARCLR